MDQNLRWQHCFLVPAGFGLMFGVLAFGVELSGTGPNTPSWVAPLIILFSLAVGYPAWMSMRRAQAREALAERLAQGLFALPPSAAKPTILLNAQMRTHFGLPDAAKKPLLPETFGDLVAAIAAWAAEGAAIQPAQHQAARRALAGVLGRDAQDIPWHSNPVELFPAGRQRFECWQLLRAVRAATSTGESEPLGRESCYLWFPGTTHCHRSSHRPASR